MAKGPPKGHPKWGGRQKGTLNIRTRSALEILAKLKGGNGEPGFDPITELVECYHRTANTDGVMHVAVKCLDILMPYVYPKISTDLTFTPADIALVEQIKELSRRPRHEIIEIAKTEMNKVE